MGDYISESFILVHGYGNRENHNHGIGILIAAESSSLSPLLVFLCICVCPVYEGVFMCMHMFANYGLMCVFLSQFSI